MRKMTTKQKILKAAKELFIEHGFAGTSMGNIAKHAGVNHSLLFHHFGNKENLWVAVKVDIAENATMQTLPSTDLSFADFIEKLFKNNLRFYYENPDMMQLMNWQRIERDKNSKPLPQSSESDIWIAAFEHYQKQGEITDKVPARFIIMFILSLISSTALDSKVLIKSRESKRYIDFCIQKIVNAFEI